MTEKEQENSSSRAASPELIVTACNEDNATDEKSNVVHNENSLSPTSRGMNDSLSESDRYYTASSGDESEENVLNTEDDVDDDDDDDDDELCIRLDSDDDDQSLSGLHINLKTLQAVSSMLAHYSPVIQSDMYGNPMFVAPAPPEDDYISESGESTPKKTSSINNSARNSKCGQNKRLLKQAVVSENDDYEGVLQQLDDVIYSQDKSLLSDAMTELTNVMEKMTRYNDDVNENQ